MRRARDGRSPCTTARRAPGRAREVSMAGARTRGWASVWATAILAGCALPLASDRPAPWATPERLLVTFHAPATDKVVRFEAGNLINGELAEARGVERAVLVAGARACGCLLPNDHVVACFVSDLDGQ